VKGHVLRRFNAIGLIFLLAQCISEFDPGLVDETPQLVVDGLITDQPGPYTVRLMYSAAYSNNTITGIFPQPASVTLFDDAGNSEKLKYTSNGFYSTSVNGMKGVIGYSYWIEIIFSDGKKYESRPELLGAVNQIDTIYTEYVPLQSEFLRGKYATYIDATDPGGSRNYYKWSWMHYEVKTLCGISYDFPPLTKVEWSCCQACWNVTRCEGCINILSDEYIDGKKIAKQFLLDIPYNSVDPYFLLVKQESLTQPAFKFWSTIRSLVSNSGGIFDTPPIAVEGNIFNTSDPEEIVLGYFGASAVSLKGVHIPRLRSGEPPAGYTGPTMIPPRRSCKPCEETYLSTAIKPIGWED